MDVGDICKVANRKRINADAEKLREKVSRETAKIIKLKVAQDTAYWDLKEKLQQLENNHERLQQNMVEVQMQHETISGQYQDELRLRPETLNKLSSTRSICDVLEEYSERLKDTVARCKADQAALADAYQKSGHFVKEVNMKHAQSDERNRVTVANLQDKIKLTSEHQAQLVSLFTSTQSQLEGEARALRARLDAALQQREELAGTVSGLQRELDVQRQAVETKEARIATLHEDMQRLIREATLQCQDLQAALDKTELQLKECRASEEGLKLALANQEQFSAAARAQSSRLQEQLAAEEEQRATLLDDVAALQGKLHDLTVTSDALRRDVAALVDTRDHMEKQAEEQKQLLNNAAAQIESMTSQLDSLQLEKSATEQQLARASEEVRTRGAAGEALQQALQQAEERAAGLEAAMEELRVSHEEKIQELTSTLETKQKENTSKGETINKLMNDVTMCMEVRSRLETHLAKLRRDADADSERARERETALRSQLDQLEGVKKEKEQELSKQMSIILEIRGEKEKLQEKISGMQNTIDNIQKELTGRAPPPPRLEAEQDDNAVTYMQQGPQSSAPEQFLRPHCRRPERPEKQLDIFNIFSDSSLDGDNMLDPVEVNRRFEAISRGERVGSLPLPLKRRRAPPPPPPGKAGGNDTPISLSQVRGEIKSKGNTFFRNKRNENKLKRFRKIGGADENE